MQPSASQHLLMPTESWQCSKALIALRGSDCVVVRLCEGGACSCHSRLACTAGAACVLEALVCCWHSLICMSPG